MEGELFVIYCLKEKSIFNFKKEKLKKKKQLFPCFVKSLESRGLLLFLVHTISPSTCKSVSGFES